MEAINKKVLDILQDNSPIEITFKSCIPYTCHPPKYYENFPTVSIGDSSIMGYNVGAAKLNEGVMHKIKQAIIDIITEDSKKDNNGI